MNRELHACLSPFTPTTFSALEAGKINPRPIAEYAERAGAVFDGFKVLIEMMQVNDMLDEDDKAGGNPVPHLQAHETTALLSMMRAVSSAMANESDNLANWANNAATPRSAKR